MRERIVLDRHVTEFFPQFFREGAYFGRTLGVDVFSLEGTIARGDAIHAQMAEDAHAPPRCPRTTSSASRASTSR
jgi:alpha-galactosidase